VTVYMLGLLQHVWCVCMPKCELCSEIVIRCETESSNCVLRSEIVIHCQNCVGCRELPFAAENELSAVNL